MAAFNATLAHRTMAELGRKGGLSRSPALTEARRRNGKLGGAKPTSENFHAMETVADAIDNAKTPADRAFLIEAFTRLAPETVYQDRWRLAWGPCLSVADRRHLRGWGPKHRLRATMLAGKITGAVVKPIR